MFEILFLWVFLFGVGCRFFQFLSISFTLTFSLSSIYNQYPEKTLHSFKMNIRVTFSRFCKEMPTVIGADSIEEVLQFGSDSFFTSTDIHWCIDYFLVASWFTNALLTIIPKVLSWRSYIFGQISWLDQIKRKLKVKRTQEKKNRMKTVCWKKIPMIVKDSRIKFFSFTRRNSNEEVHLFVIYLGLL